MKVLIINIDSKIPNLALKKIEKYHLDHNDKVLWDLPLWRNSVDKVYVSCVFSKNKNQCKEWNGAEIGGSGYSLTKELSPEIEAVKPRINLGFTTRGCIRKCPFCIVPEKEGKIRIVGDLYDIWDNKSKNVVLLDNNILGLKKQFFKICQQAQKENLIIEFNQGLDIRLLTFEIAKELKKTRLSELWFAWDNMKDEDIIKKGIEILKGAEIKSFRFYVIVGFNTTIEQDLYRFNTLKEITMKEKLNIRPYCMRHENCNGKKEYIRMAEWVNMPWLFMRQSYKETVQFMDERPIYNKNKLIENVLT